MDLCVAGATIGLTVRPAIRVGQPNWEKSCPRLWITLGKVCGERRKSLWTVREVVVDNLWTTT